MSRKRKSAIVQENKIMLNYLEQLLNEKTRGQKDEILYTQWQLAKNSVPQVLETISNIFPHYTLHNKTHSEAILENIGKIIKKDTFNLFSSGDIWLLLFSAFYHDIGMAAYAYDLDKILKKDNFVDYLRRIQVNQQHPLYTHASYFEIETNRVLFKEKDVSLKKIEALKFILAEYIRAEHGKRTEEYLERDDSSLNWYNNPIPKRLIGILGKICECHTESFSKVMDLPFEETGISYEACHPRYIACLLRLGDLLDLDSNRVSDIVLRTVTSIPTESYFHIQKNLSISHTMINSKQIEITAVCEEYKTADLASNWFSWIDQEITNQMKNWSNIVPNSDFGFLPIVGNLKVELKNYDSINGKMYPKFEIDTNRAIELFQGAGLYKEPCQSIREILQNSVDATYLRIWFEKEKLDIDPFKKECNKKKYEIKVTIKKTKSSSDGYNSWHITISDSGIGMSKEDLEYLCKIGASSDNVEKQKKIMKMPEWMKPSGTFGIGFQSIFLLTDKVHIKTRKYNHQEVYDIDLYKPAGKDNGTVLLKTTKDDCFTVGTELGFDLLIKKIPEKITYSGKHKIAYNNFSNFDFTKNDSLDFEIWKLIDETIIFSQASNVRILLNVSDENNTILQFDNFDDENNTILQFDHFDREKNLEIKVAFDDIYEYRESKIFYRNQLIQKANIRGIYFLPLDVNILGCNAKDVLSLNRNEINSRYSQQLLKDIIISVKKYLHEKYNEFEDEYKRYASMFLYFYSEKDELDKLEESEKWKWKEYEITVINENNEEKIPLKRLPEKVDYVKIYENHNNDKKIYELGKKELTVKFDDFFNDLCINEAKLLYEIFCNISYVDDNGSRYTLLSSNEKLQPIDKNSWKSWFKNFYLFRNRTARGLIPCNSDYIKLALKEDVFVPYTDNYVGIPPNFSYPKMVSPYIIERSGILRKLKKDIPDSLINYVFKNRKDETVTKEEIRETYDNFTTDVSHVIAEINDEIDKQNKYQRE